MAEKSREITHVTFFSEKLTANMTLAVASDLHNGKYDDLLEEISTADAVLIPGDLVLRYDNGWQCGFGFLEKVSKMKPTFMSIGNHEVKMPDSREFMAKAAATDAVILDNSFAEFDGIQIGGFSSVVSGKPDYRALKKNLPKDGTFKLLMCHQPEYFQKYVQQLPIDLTVAGHAHGGQVRLFGRGLYAPGQGFLPEVTEGFHYEGRLLVSRGLTNTVPIPRLFNKTQLIMLHLTNANNEKSSCR